MINSIKQLGCVIAVVALTGCATQPASIRRGENPAPDTLTMTRDHAPVMQLGCEVDKSQQPEMKATGPFLEPVWPCKATSKQ